MSRSAARLEHAREQHPRDAVSYRAVNYEPLIESGHMHLLDGDGEVAPGVEVRVAPGHNRDMMIVLVRSGGETWCHFADLVEYASQIDAHMGERRSIFSRSRRLQAKRSCSDARPPRAGGAASDTTPDRFCED